MTDLLRSRFSDAPWMKDITEKVAIVGGAAGIGSWLTLLLARTGIQVEVYDFDTLEQHNIGGQWYKTQNIGKAKVDALQENVKDFTDETIVANNERVTENTLTSDIVFSAFDNMKARKDLFQAWKEQNKDNPNAIFIDGRLAAEQWEMYCITRGNEAQMAYYESPDILFEDSEVQDAPCTMKQTSQYAAMLGSFMVSALTNHLTNVNACQTERRVATKTTYVGQLNRFKTEYIG